MTLSLYTCKIRHHLPLSYSSSLFGLGNILLQQTYIYSKTIIHMTVTAMKVKYIYRTFVDVTFVSRHYFI